MFRAIRKWIKSFSNKNASKQSDYQLEDFVEELDEVMENQLKKNPELLEVHARLDPAWENMKQIALNAVNTDDVERRNEYLKQLNHNAELANHVMVDLLRQYRNIGACDEE